MDAPRSRLDALAGLRFCAAAGILLFHYGGPLLAGGPAWAEAVRAGGHAWVGLFYVLSGFVLARAHPSPMSPGDQRAFLAARLARLYPAYLLAFVLFAPFALERWSGGGLAGAGRAAIVAASSLLLIQAWLPPIARIWNPPGWSTSVVASFYAAFPYLIARLAPLSRRGLAGVMAAAWGLSLAGPMAYLAFRPDGPGAEGLPHEPPWLEALKFHPLPRAGEFVAGAALGLLHRRGLGLGGAGGAAAAAGLAAAVGVLAWGGAPYVLVHNGLLVPLYAVTVLGLAGRGVLPRVLGSRAAVALGDASFALYALQEPLWRWARALLAPPGAPATPAFVGGFALFAVAAALLVSAGLERPARRWLRRALGGAGSDRPRERRRTRARPPSPLTRAP
jgi:peptidoglycan/LPS O-acetylase OafA/YrhL